MIGFQDEKWTELLGKTQRAWTPKGQTVAIATPGYTKRVNCFITLFWPGKRIVWDCFNRRRNIEFRRHLSHLVDYAKRRKIKKIILFIDWATYHRTPAVKKFFRQHPLFKKIFLGKKDPNMNPVERTVNKRIASAISVNRCYSNRDKLRNATKSFLRKYNSIYAT